MGKRTVEAKIGEEEKREKCALAIGAEEVFARTGHWSSAHTGVKPLVETLLNSSSVRTHRPWWYHGTTMVNPSAHSNCGVHIRWDGWDGYLVQTEPRHRRLILKFVCSVLLKQITALLINHLSVVHCF